MPDKPCELIRAVSVAARWQVGTQIAQILSNFFDHPGVVRSHSAAGRRRPKVHPQGFAAPGDLEEKDWRGERVADCPAEPELWADAGALSAPARGQKRTDVAVLSPACEDARWGVVRGIACGQTGTVRVQPLDSESAGHCAGCGIATYQER